MWTREQLQLLFMITPVPRGHESEILTHLFTFFYITSLFFLDKHFSISHLNVLFNIFRVKLLEVAPVHIRGKHIDSLYRGR